MSTKSDSLKGKLTENFYEFSLLSDYSFMNSLKADPKSTKDGNDHKPRSVYSGHYVPVVPTAIPDPEYISHSNKLFKELRLSSDLTKDQNFCRFFSGDISVAKYPMSPVGWATGYALSIYGTEYTQQCPFGTGNGYGDGRAISVFEGLFNGKRMEMQLKGGGPTPYCRGADGRAVLRSSVREFLAQELMNALGIPTSRSLTLYVSRSEIVRRPWYSKGSRYFEPDIMIDNQAAITTRVAPSFLRVGQIELFARRVRNNAHDEALNELKMIVQHLIDRNYKDEIEYEISIESKVIKLASLYRSRLISLIANWMRVGYCQGNFNSDNCAAGGYTLDYGPFGFCELFDPRFQPWTGGGEHFSFFNQSSAAAVNFKTFCSSLSPLLSQSKKDQEKLDRIEKNFSELMNKELMKMWANKLGLEHYNETLINEFFNLMVISKADYTILFRKLSEIPDNLDSLKDCFYLPINDELNNRWEVWLESWQSVLKKEGNIKAKSASMKSLNPVYTWREWMVVPAYEEAEKGNYKKIKELQEVFSNPYVEQSPEIDQKYNRLKPSQYFNYGGVSHYSCSS
ncbi:MULTISPECIES: protein adenylyltransferase SelO family protein [Prochlorococcus]|uniref:Protein nucleotidyltransferase YdiU n=1 Tax=Prochlorococcus marinus str. MIT 9314 TaxID=167548 RepID=A0A0A2AEW9_PROMR|nr:protein adenylyltransferase SelO family protein [Prochlorococcus marinus]KGG00438.1 Selenoprotein O-like [Prochlorococcus marinus str. MIT 9314]